MDKVDRAAIMICQSAGQNEQVILLKIGIKAGKI